MTDPIATLRAYIDAGKAEHNYDQECAVALDELERRARIEARRDAWLAAGRKADKPRYIEHHWDSWPADQGGEFHEIELYELTECEWVRVFKDEPHRGPDYHTALEAALNAGGAP